MSLWSRIRTLTARPYGQAGPAGAAALVEDGAFLLDVREKSEFNAGHAPQARNIPLADLAARLNKLPSDRPIVTACRSGARSAHAARLLAREGYEAVNLSGGMQAWKRTGLPVVGSGGRPGRIT